MEASTLNKIAEILLILMALTLCVSILLMLGGKNIYKKASKKPNTVLYPIVNLFTMLEITEISIFWGILFFVPGLNVLVIMAMFYKLGSVFGCKLFYKLGLAILPVIFYPMLAFSDKQYKVADQEYFKMLVNTRKKDLNLMTEKDIQELNKEPMPEEPKVDSIFKDVKPMKEDIQPYKAVRIDLIGMNKLKEANIDEKLNPKEEVNNNASPEKKNSLEMKELNEEKDKKKDNIEFVDL